MKVGVRVSEQDRKREKEREEGGRKKVERRLEVKSQVWLEF